MKYQLRVTSYIVCRSECDTIIVAIAVVMDEIGFSFSFSDPCTRAYCCRPFSACILTQNSKSSRRKKHVSRSTLAVAEHLL